jgi:small-conductance mechanosensitive channel
MYHARVVHERPRFVVAGAQVHWWDCEEVEPVRFDDAAVFTGTFAPTFQEIYSQIVSIWTHEITLAVGGDLKVSIKSLVFAALILLLSLRASKVARRVFRSRVLRKTPLDSGLVYALERLVHYLVVTVAILFALKVGFGADYTSLAVMVTALSVGIGLGLKEIAGDVAAGFILLFERPVRVGDRVKLRDSVEGDVISIGLRTTKVVTNDKLTVIVPNSRLTNEDYVNWSYLDQPVRLHVPVGVAYGTDVGLVRQALVAAAMGVNRVAAEPRPDVRLVRFGDSSMDFEVLVWTTEPTAHPQIRSDVNFGIEREFRKAGIEIPFPQRDVHVRALPQ